ncbi:hypothetical protein SLEP1_g22833 [Rubroshorea leprosula]|uniref:Uncharacterized protein n=1 Tax=Rubroshorea leprosula TaxID=152421 RepID=A0AAV5JFR5_9ROSI|nr:hypothetical protein SLEP1_g22833 [Rubroshorea leprosula]
MEKKRCGVLVLATVVLMLVGAATAARTVTDRTLSHHNGQVSRNLLSNGLGMTPPMG